VPNNWSLYLRFCDDQGLGVPFHSGGIHEHQQEGP
jgi:hypothetical protein